MKKAEHYFSAKQTSKLNMGKISAVLRGKKFEFYTGSGVFSKTKVDDGTYLLIREADIKSGSKILDLGCGYGPVGIVFAKLKKCDVVMADSNERAVMLTKKNAELNKVQVDVRVSDIFSKVPEKFDTILLNPPQTAGKNVCFRMIEESKEHLVKGGTLQIVARPKKGGKTLAQFMIKIFGNAYELGKGAGFKVYMSRK
ncbi:methyltransferase [Candidatus Woesearchaeota archaeon]|nr:methyltransferase [Candidatus Woesearchaeota archaeon]